MRGGGWDEGKGGRIEEGKGGGGRIEEGKGGGGRNGKGRMEKEEDEGMGHNHNIMNCISADCLHL